MGVATGVTTTPVFPLSAPFRRHCCSRRRNGVCKGSFRDLKADGVSAWTVWTELRESAPLIQCITNYVSMDIMANGLLAAGCSPAMVHGSLEVEDFVPLASALLINIGTLDDGWVESMRIAARKAKEIGRPWVLDPVGAGATAYRTEVCKELLAFKPTVIRGNASEIMAVAGIAGGTKGVDSTISSEDAIQMGRSLATEANCVVAISGAKDLVTDGYNLVAIENGHPMLQKVTATGLAGELAWDAASPKGPASFRSGLLDILHIMGEGEVERGVRMQILD